ncbi:MAG: hypothetical protein AAB909_03760 [Patescibacteria group bacterium]
MPDEIKTGDTVAREVGLPGEKEVVIGTVKEVSPEGQIRVEIHPSQGGGPGVWNKDSTDKVPDRE